LALSRAIAILACSAWVSGCASIFEGTTQQISVSTTPPGARCTFWRNGALIADVPVTPGAATIDKTKDELVIVCTKPGYTAASFVNKSGLAMATFANILTAGLAWAVDSSRGADNKYQGEVNLALAPSGTAAPVGGPMPQPLPEPAPAVPQPRGGVPPQAPPVVTPAAAPAAPQIECAASDGSRIRVTGAVCPAGWTPAR